MRNVILFSFLWGFITLAILVGIKKTPVAIVQNYNKETNSRVPTIGRIEILNGCGISGAASAVADFLREKGFDVKNIENAPSWNYTSTIIVSRTKDMTIAREISDALNTKNCILLRTDDDLYNVSIYLGSDFGELIQ